MKILHLEDNAADAELLRHLFAGEWPDCEITAVASQEDFVGALPGGHDLILSDFNLTNFDGLEALRLARKEVPETPFLFFSGTIGEDRAIEALHAGACDYVIKDRPKRLVPAMRRALEQARLARERKIAEEQMLRVQRLENIGMLAAGIAHDFNNVLAPVMIGVPLLRSRLKGETDERILTSMENSALRGAGLVRQILGFAQGVTGEAQLIQPKHLIRELVGVIEQTFPKTIEIEHEFESEPWPLKVNPTQLHQVLLNLCVNARDAMPAGGKLRLRVANRTLGDNGTSMPNAAPGPYVFFEVSDTGTGIPPSILPRIWDPFFTTKQADRGTGLGLATVRGIVKNHGGAVAVKTEAGRGTAFQIYLPASPGEALHRLDAARVESPRGTGELILVADDDANVRDLTTATLTEHGYHVLSAADGAEAVALFAARSLEIRAIITDLDMPVLDGVALVKVARSLSPSVRVLLTSGSSEAGDVRRRTLDFVKFLAKPFPAFALLEAVHELLREPIDRQPLQLGKGKQECLSALPSTSPIG